MDWREIIKATILAFIVYGIITAVLWGFELRIHKTEISFEGIVKEIEKIFEK